jgi:predicted nucleotidyltransferase
MAKSLDLAQLGQDAEIEQVVLVRSRARGNARPDSDFDLLISDAATTTQWAGSRWRVLGRIRREVILLDAS